MDGLPEMDFDGGIDSLDLSSVGNAEEVGGSTLLPSISDRSNYGASTQDRLRMNMSIPYSVNGSLNANIRTDHGGQVFQRFHRPTVGSNTSHSHVQESRGPHHVENAPVDIGMDFDVDSFFNTTQKAQDGVRDLHADKVSTVIHYVPATDINCSDPNNPCDRDCGEQCERGMRRQTSCGSDNHNQSSQKSSDEKRSLTSSGEKPPCTEVVSVNSSPLCKQNKMARDLLGLLSVARDVPTNENLSSRLIPGKGIVLGISRKSAGNEETSNSNAPGNDKDSDDTHLHVKTESGGESAQSKDSDITAKELRKKETTAAVKSESDTEEETEAPPSVTRDRTRSSGGMVEYNVHIDDTQKIIDEDGNIRWSCNICSGTYASKHNLVTHILSHNNIRPHYCLRCGKMFRQLSHLQTHLLTHSNTRPHSCHICRRAFTQPSHLKRHLITHQDRQSLSCKFCGRGFAYASELKAHEAKHEVAKSNSCSHCSLTFDTSRKLKRHIASVHSKSKDLSCSECNKVFNYPSQLRDHMLRHTGKREYACGQCDMKFMKEHHLRAHQITHTDAKPYTCPTCTRAFNQHGNLQRHMLIHSQEKQFKCKICEKAFAQQQVLNTHMLTHSEEKPHKCSVCGKGFTRAHNLKAHMSMHKDKKPHSCLCGASFTVKGNLNRHRKQYHGACGKISLEEEAAFILKSMSDKTYDTKAAPDKTDAK